MTVSIVIPTTGRETLERAIASAAACADEVIVVADGAPHVGATVHVDVGAPGLARNAGVEAATCEWVGFLDDDDRLHGHVLNGLSIYSPADLPGG